MEDRISNLPESILLHILSYLPFKQALCTSVLAKQWKYLWISLPNLDLDQQKDKLGIIGFMDFVDQLLRRRGAMSLSRFHLSCSRFCDKSRIDSWMHTIAQLYVKELALSSHFEFGPYLEVSLRFTECQSLSVLEFKCIQFPHDFNGDLFSSYFPWLENISLERCMMPPTLNISCPLLKTFHIKDDIYPTLEHLTITAKDLEKLVLNMWHGSSFRISAPNLKSFKWIECYASDVSLENLTSIWEADILLDTHMSLRKNYNLLLKLLCSLSNVRLLELREDCFEVLFSSQNLFKPLPVFAYMRSLEARVVLCKEAIYVLKHLLHNCPNIKSLTVDSSRKCHFHSSQPSHIDDQLGFKCSLNHLTDVDINYFKAGDDEFTFVESLLKDAAVLERLVIRPFSTEHDASKLIRKLQGFPTVSSCIKISITGVRIPIFE